MKMLLSIWSFFTHMYMRMRWVCLAFLVLMLLILLFDLLFVHKRKDKIETIKEDFKEKSCLSNGRFKIEIGNCQGIGEREEQQDAFGFSPSKFWKDKGFLAVLCDGMGGLDSGATISNKLVSDIIADFPYSFDDLKDGWILNSLSKEIFDSYRGRGGTTVVIAYVRDDQMWFASVGDSDLLLYRDGRIYSMNERQEYGNTLLMRVADGALSIQQALDNRDAPALTEFMGAEQVDVDYSVTLWKVHEHDVYLLCSDGVSDTLSFDEIKEAMSHDPVTCTELIEKCIMKKNKRYQDNYTAIAFAVNEIGGIEE